jgi:hypothetical protein
MGSPSPPGAAMTDSEVPPTKATADLLRGLLARVPLSDAQIARATLADPATIQAWLRRHEAPAGLEAQRLTELVAFVEEMAINLPGETLAGSWLDGNVDFLSGANPLDKIASGNYEQMIQYAIGLTNGIFT